MDYTGDYSPSESGSITKDQAPLKRGIAVGGSSYKSMIQLPATVEHGMSSSDARHLNDRLSRYAKATRERSPTSSKESNPCDDEDHGLFVPDHGNMSYEYGSRHSITTSPYGTQASLRSKQVRADHASSSSMPVDSAMGSEHRRGVRPHQAPPTLSPSRSSQAEQQVRRRQVPSFGGYPSRAKTQSLAAGNSRRDSMSMFSEAEQGFGDLDMDDDINDEDDNEDGDYYEEETHSHLTPPRLLLRESDMSASGVSGQDATSMRPNTDQTHGDMYAHNASRAELSSPTKGPDYRVTKKKPHVNKAPTFVPMSSISDAALAKRGVTRAHASQLSKRTAGANDPENVLIVDLKENKGMLWDDIAQLLNDERIKAGRKASFTANAVHNRYNRNAPVLFAAEGKAWVPISDRKLPIMIKTNWTPELDVLLVQAMQEVEAEKWSRVAARFCKLSGHQIGAKEVAFRNQAI